MEDAVPGPTPLQPKPLLLNLFEMNCVSHITHGLWRLAGNHRHEFNDIGYWTRLAQLAEEAQFDAIFLADVIGAYDVYRDGPDTAVREGLQIPSNDPIEDDHAEKIIEVPSNLAATDGANASDWMFWGVFDGHR